MSFQQRHYFIARGGDAPAATLFNEYNGRVCILKLCLHGRRGLQSQRSPIRPRWWRKYGKEESAADVTAWSINSSPPHIPMLQTTTTLQKL